VIDEYHAKNSSTSDVFGFYNIWRMTRRFAILFVFGTGMIGLHSAPVSHAPVSHVPFNVGSEESESSDEAHGHGAEAHGPGEVVDDHSEYIRSKLSDSDVLDKRALDRSVLDRSALHNRVLDSRVLDNRVLGNKLSDSAHDRKRSEVDNIGRSRGSNVDDSRGSNLDDTDSKRSGSNLNDSSSARSSDFGDRRTTRSSDFDGTSASSLRTESDRESPTQDSIINSERNDFQVEKDPVEFAKNKIETPPPVAEKENSSRWKKILTEKVSRMFFGPQKITSNASQSSLLLAIPDNDKQRRGLSAQAHSELPLQSEALKQNQNQPQQCLHRPNAISVSRCDVCAVLSTRRRRLEWFWNTKEFRSIFTTSVFSASYADDNEMSEGDNENTEEEEGEKAASKEIEKEETHKEIEENEATTRKTFADLSTPEEKKIIENTYHNRPELIEERYRLAREKNRRTKKVVQPCG